MDPGIHYMMKKEFIISALAVLLLLSLACCARPGYAMRISALDGGGAEDCDFDIDVMVGTYPNVSVLVSYTGPEEELEIYTGRPMVGLALYDGDGRPVGASMTQTVSAPVTLQRDEPKATAFDLSHLAQNMGGSLSEGVYRLEVTLSYTLSHTSGDVRTANRSFALELTRAAQN